MNCNQYIITLIICHKKKKKKLSKLNFNFQFHLLDHVVCISTRTASAIEAEWAVNISRVVICKVWDVKSALHTLMSAHQCPGERKTKSTSFKFLISSWNQSTYLLKHSVSLPLLLEPGQEVKHLADLFLSRSMSLWLLVTTTSLCTAITIFLNVSGWFWRCLTWRLLKPNICPNGYLEIRRWHKTFIKYIVAPVELAFKQTNKQTNILLLSQAGAPPIHKVFGKSCGDWFYAQLCLSWTGTEDGICYSGKLWTSGEQKISVYVYWVKQ